jgi:hypothetical protein
MGMMVKGAKVILLNDVSWLGRTTPRGTEGTIKSVITLNNKELLAREGINALYEVITAEGYKVLCYNTEISTERQNEIEWE